MTVAGLGSGESWRGRQVCLREEVWTLKELVGSGGYGRVFAASSSRGVNVALKYVKRTNASEREFEFVSLSSAAHLMSILDQGEDEDGEEHYKVLAMPLAERSLRELIDDSRGRVPLEEALSILTDIAAGLADLEDEGVVHRDVKPENILQLNGAWLLSDFGIAKYVEAATAPDTHKAAMSHTHAAPERWRGERATSATDIYSWGVVAHELVNGRPPFKGKDREGYQEQHLLLPAPQITGVPPAFAALVTECLAKAPGARPSASDILRRLDSLRGPSNSGLGRLAAANLSLAARRVRREDDDLSLSVERSRREELFGSAREIFGVLEAYLRNLIEREATEAVHCPDQAYSGGWTLAFGPAMLSLSGIMQTEQPPWEKEDPSAFEVIAHAWLSVEIPSVRDGYAGRSHSLWYGDAQVKGQYQWFETAFAQIPPLSIHTPRDRKEPFALSPGDRSTKALCATSADALVAWPFTPLRVGEIDDFVVRWAGWLADAAEGHLIRPFVIPEQPTEGTWRRAG